MASGENMDRRQKLKRFGHFFAGLLIIFHAFERFDHGHGTWLLFAFAGLVFLSVALLHSQLAKRFPWIDSVFFAIEAVLSLTIMFEFYHAGKKGLPFMYLIAALLQVFAAVKTGKKGFHAPSH